MPRRPPARAAALAAVPVLLVGAACTGPEEPGATSETEDPVVLDPGEEQGESLLPANPDDAGTGTDG